MSEFCADSFLGFSLSSDDFEKFSEVEPGVDLEGVNSALAGFVLFWEPEANVSALILEETHQRVYDCESSTVRESPLPSSEQLAEWTRKLDAAKAALSLDSCPSRLLIAYIEP